MPELLADDTSIVIGGQCRISTEPCHTQCESKKRTYMIEIPKCTVCIAYICGFLGLKPEQSIAETRLNRSMHSVRKKVGQEPFWLLQLASPGRVESIRQIQPLKNYMTGRSTICKITQSINRTSSTPILSQPFPSIHTLHKRRIEMSLRTKPPSCHSHTLNSPRGRQDKRRVECQPCT